MCCLRGRRNSRRARAQPNSSPPPPPNAGTGDSAQTPCVSPTSDTASLSARSDASAKPTVATAAESATLSQGAPAPTSAASTPLPAASPTSCREPAKLSVLSPSPTPFPIMLMTPVPDASNPLPPHRPRHPRRVYVSLSSDLRLIYIRPGSSEPASILSFRSADVQMPLDRMPGSPPLDPSLHPAAALGAATKLRAKAASHTAGPAVRISDGSRRTVILVADSEDERDAFLLALQLRVAPWTVLVAHMKDEMTAAHAAVAASPSLAGLAREVFAGGAEDALVDGEVRSLGAARKVWEMAGGVSEMTLWTATFGKAIGEVARSAEDLERLTKPFGRLAVVGCAFSIVALSARAVNLMALERGGRAQLGKARDDLQRASLSLVGWLLSILGSGFHDGDGLVDRAFGVLEDCWQVAKDLELYLLRRWPARVWSADDIHVIGSKVDTVRGKLFGVGLLSAVACAVDQIDDLEGRMSGLEVPAVDEFRIPAISNIELGVGLVAGAATCLARLKAAVLPLKWKETVSAEMIVDECPSGPNSRRLPRIALTSISGEGGVGKTSTCRLLCGDEDVWTHFSMGAIVWIDVGKNATDEKVKDEVRRAVSKFGGKRSAQEVRFASNVFEAVEIARAFFSQRCILVVLDNVWETPAGYYVESWTGTLAKIASRSGSAVIATSRSSNLAKGSGFDQLSLGRLDLTSASSLDWHVAEDLYDDLLKSSDGTQLSPEYRKRRRKALVLSCGLLLGIRTFVSLVNSLHDIGDDVDALLLQIEKRAIGLASRAVGSDERASVGHPGLFAAIEESLAFLDEQKSDLVESKPVLSPATESAIVTSTLRASYANFSNKAFSSRYAALHMLEASSPAMSFSNLRHLWHVATIEEVKAIVRRFVDIGLGRVEGGSEKCFVLHDLQYEFCTLACRKPFDGPLAGDTNADYVPVNGHALFLCSCESLLLSIYGERDVALWPQFCFSDTKLSYATQAAWTDLREYLSRNLIRLLCSASQCQSLNVCDQNTSVADAFSTEVVSVLFNFGWLRGRLNSIGCRNSVLKDFITAFEAGALRNLDALSFHMLRDTLMLVPEDSFVQSDGTLASSFVQLSQSVAAECSAPALCYFNDLAKDADDKVLSAWLKPLSGCCRSREHGVLAKAAINTSGRVARVVPLGNDTHFVSLSSDGTVRIHDNTYLGISLALDGINNAAHISSAQQSDTEFCALIFSASSDNNVRCSQVLLNDEGRLFESSCVIVGELPSSIYCLAASSDGRFVAAGSENGRVSLWERENGTTNSYVPVADFFCLEEGSHVCFVRSIALAESGKFVVACNCRGDLAFWKAQNGREGTIERSACSSSSEDKNDLFLSNDESSLIVLFNKPTGYEVWDVEAAQRRLPRVDLPEMTKLLCANLVFSDDNGHGMLNSLLLGGYDKKDRSYTLAEYLIEDRLKNVRCCHLMMRPTSVCSAGLSVQTRLPRIILGCLDGSVSLLGDNAFYSRNASKQRGGSLVADKGGKGTNAGVSFIPDLDVVNSVAVMPKAELVVAGHRDGILTLWSGKDGSFQCVIDGERNGEPVCCVDVSLDENVAVAGYSNGAVHVWNTSTVAMPMSIDGDSWTLRYVLIGHSGDVCCVTISIDSKRVFTVDRGGELRVWDTKRGGLALHVVETGLKFRYWQTRAFLSLDRRHFILATGGPDPNNDDEVWEAKLFDAAEGRGILESEEDLEWDSLLAKISSRVSQRGAIPSWKQAVVTQSMLCTMIDFGEQNESWWEVTCSFSDSRLQCAMQSVTETVSEKSVICFDSSILSIAAHWVSGPGQDVRQRAIVACALRSQTVPAILHLIPPKV